MQYLTILLSNYKDNQAAKEMAMIITPIVDSEDLKYSNSDGIIILSFGSNLNQEEVYDYIYSATYGEVGGIFVSKTDNMSVFLGKEQSEHLFGNIGTNLDNHHTIDMEKVKEGLEGIPLIEFLSEEEDEENDIQEILNRSKIKNQIPTIDDILDKICEYGIESLTLNEKTILQKFSK